MRLRRSTSVVLCCGLVVAVLVATKVTVCSSLFDPRQPEAAAATFDLPTSFCALARQRSYWTAATDLAATSTDARARVTETAGVIGSWRRASARRDAPPELRTATRRLSTSAIRAVRTGNFDGVLHDAALLDEAARRACL